MTQPTLTLIADPQPERDSTPLIDTAELLHVGMSGGRKLVIEPKRARKPKDTLTQDLFGQKGLF